MAPSSKPGWIDWRTSMSRTILLNDLEAGVIALTGMTEEEIWDIYKQEDVFIREGVEETQFKARLKGHLAQVASRQALSSQQEEALAHDLNLHPRLPYDSTGRLLWHMSAAKNLLAKDVECKLHEKVPPRVLHSLRPEYMMFPLHIFRPHIYQEVRRQKFLFYCEVKRTKKVEKERKLYEKNIESKRRKQNRN